MNPYSSKHKRNSLRLQAIRKRWFWTLPLFIFFCAEVAPSGSPAVVDLSTVLELMLASPDKSGPDFSQRLNILEDDFSRAQKEVLERNLFRGSSEGKGSIRTDRLKRELETLVVNYRQTLARLERQFQDEVYTIWEKPVLATAVDRIFQTMSKVHPIGFKSPTMNSSSDTKWSLDLLSGSKLASRPGLSRILALDFLELALLSPESLRLYLMSFRTTLPLWGGHGSHDLTLDLISALQLLKAKPTAQESLGKKLQALRPSSFPSIDFDKTAVLCEPLLFLLHPAMVKFDWVANRFRESLPSCPIQFYSPKVIKTYLEDKSLSHVAEEIFEIFLSAESSQVADAEQTQKRLWQIRLQISSLREALRQELNLEYVFLENLVFRGRILELVSRKRLISGTCPDLTLLALKRIYEAEGISLNVYRHLEQSLKQILVLGAGAGGSSKATTNKNKQE